MPAIPLIEFCNVSAMRDGRLVLDGLSLAIAEGEHVAILGPNGSGKSSLIKLISRDLYPAQKTEPWSLRILGEERWNLFDLRGRLGVVSDDWARLCRRDSTGLETVLSGFFGSVGIWPHQRITAEMQARARESMALLEIEELAERYTDEMSSGEARRVLIARALVHNPRALVLDEPATSLDMRAAAELRDAMRCLARSGIGIILVTHHLPDIIPEIDRVVLLRGGRIHRDGPKSQVLEAGSLADLFGMPLEMLERGGYYHLL